MLSFTLLPAALASVSFWCVFQEFDLEVEFFRITQSHRLNAVCKFGMIESYHTHTYLLTPCVYFLQVVQVGDFVEVRKTSEADDWVPGVVSGVRAADGAIEIAQKGKGAIAEWDHCRPL